MYLLMIYIMKNPFLTDYKVLDCSWASKLLASIYPSKPSCSQRDVCSLLHQHLTITRNLDFNKLTGPVPDLSNFQALALIDMSGNRLNGDLPKFNFMPSLTKMYVVVSGSPKRTSAFWVEMIYRDLFTWNTCPCSCCNWT